MGGPSGLPGILTVMVDGDVFEDCPDLSVGYIREPDRIEIRFLRAAPSPEPSTEDQDQDQDQDQEKPADPAAAAADRTSGLYLDAATGYLGIWSRYNEAPGEELDTLVTYLEETADMLEAPDLGTRDKPGLIGGALVWLSGIDPAQEERWQPLTA